MIFPFKWISIFLFGGNPGIDKIKKDDVKRTPPPRFIGAPNEIVRSITIPESNKFIVVGY